MPPQHRKPLAPTFVASVFGRGEPPRTDGGITMAPALETSLAPKPRTGPSRGSAVPIVGDGAREMAGLGLGRLTVDGTHATLHVLLNPIYNMTLGVNPVALSTVTFIQRIWDAVLDPYFGQFSDNFRSRWGRRLPLMAIAALPLALLFAGLWWFPKGATESYLFWHLLVVSLAFYAFHSLYAMPLGGLLVEATDDYHARTRVASVALVFGFAFSIASQWVFALVQSSVFTDTLTGLHWVAAGFAIVFAVTAMAPLFLCKEHAYTQAIGRRAKLPVIASLKAARSNPDFMRLLAARFVAQFGYNVVGMLGIYMNTYYVFGGDVKHAAFFYGFLGSAYHISAIASSLVLYPFLARRLGKKTTLQCSAVILTIGCLLKFIAYQPGHPYWQFVVLITNGSMNAGMLLMSASMLGDVVDLDEWRTGVRRESFFFALLSWADKAGNSLGALFGGVVLVGIGFNAGLGAQSPATLQMMKACYAIAPMAGALLAVWLIHRYQLNESRVNAIRTELALRR